MNAVATNQAGWNVEQLHPWPLGWLIVNAAAFDTEGEAQLHMDGLPKVAGIEYRVYPALKEE